MKISIIIPTYNHLEDCLKPCVESIIKYTNLNNIELIIVSNGSVDGTENYIENLNIECKLVTFDKPIGYTKAINEGIKNSSGDYYLLLNNDTVLLEQKKNLWIDLLLQPFLLDQKTGITGPMKVYCPYSCHDFLIFFCVLIKKECLEKVGLLDEIFNPGFGEDVDFCIKAEKLGYNIIQVPENSQYFYDKNRMVGNFPIYHQGEATLQETNTNKELFNISGNDLLNKNRLILLNKYGKGKIKLNLGCGNRLIEGFINIDKNYPCDLQQDVKNLQLENNSVKEILASHIIEHISPFDVLNTLKEWKRVLINNGKLTIELPNILEICKNFEKSSKDKRYELLNCIYGTTYIETPHLFGWYPEIFEELLKESGFVNIHQVQCTSDHWGYNMKYECYKQKKHKIYDGFMFFNELDLLEIRLNELYDYVDHFIIVEATKTISGKDKPLFFSQNKQRFKDFLDKIIHIVVDDFPIDSDPWFREQLQRDAIAKGFINCQENDILIISDIDEIPSLEALKKYDQSYGLMSLEQDLYYYYFNCKGGKWNWCKILSYKTYKEWKPNGVSFTPSLVRYFNCPSIKNGGWHFSFMGGIDKIIEKIESYSHQEYNQDKFKNYKNIKNIIKNGNDIFNRNLKFDFVRIDNTYPKFIINNYNYFKDKGYIFNEK